MSEQQRRTLPENELDLNLMITDSVWGKSEVPEELKTRLNRLYESAGMDGKSKITTESLWGLLGFYTRDMRLANLSSWNGEVAYCQYYLDLAGDLLQDNYVEPFIICLSRAATLLELSQSKAGFLRRRMNTITSESKTMSDEPPKKSLVGGSKKARY